MLPVTYEAHQPTRLGEAVDLHTLPLDTRVVLVTEEGATRAGRWGGFEEFGGRRRAVLRTPAGTLTIPDDRIAEGYRNATRPRGVGKMIVLGVLVDTGVVLWLRHQIRTSCAFDGCRRPGDE